jgi:hypothetical protein
MQGLRPISGDKLKMPSLSLSESFSNSDFPPLPTAPEIIMIPRNKKKSLAETALIWQTECLCFDFFCGVV